MNDLLNKSQMSAVYQDRGFGNKTRSWLSVIDFLQDCTKPFPVTLMYRGIAGGAKYPHYAEDLFTAHGVQGLAQKWLSLGAEANRIVVTESIPDEIITVQGEIVERPECGYALHYSYVKARMRRALAQESFHHRGPGALLLLKRHMDENSYTDLRCLFDLYPEHAIEFSTCSRSLGCLPNRNTVFWEVRKY